MKKSAEIGSKVTRSKKSNGRRSRRKGHQFERDVAILLRPVFPEARRHLEYQAEEAQGVDLDGTGSYKIQCKKLRAYSPISAIKEVVCDQFLGDVPVLITAGDNEPPVAVLPLDEFIRLIGAFRSYRR